jgi:diaminopimelate decarboxylase
MATVTEKSWAMVCSEIGSLPVAELVRKYGTPTFVYEAEVIVRQIEKLRQFDVIRYAQKANSNLAVLDLMRRHGVVVDAVSVGEVYRARRAGYEYSAPANETAPIVYTADIFDRETLDLVDREKIHPNLGSPDMISQFGERCPGRSITLRINPGFGHGHSQKTNTGGSSSKHGIWHTQVDECLALAKRYNLAVTGLHMHIGSGTDFEHLAQVCAAMEKVAVRVGSQLQTVSVGGGLPTPYRDEDREIDIDRYFKLWDASRKRLEASVGHSLTLEIEPGRYPVAECGFLIAEIRAIKDMGENKFYLLDAGFNNLARPILYGAYHPMAIAFRNPPEKVQYQDVVVGGPLCESGDIFTQADGGTVLKRSLPVATVGDYLVIGCAGAYGFVMGSNYNSKTMAAEVLIEDRIDHLVRRREPVEDLCRLESIPKH